MGRALGSADIGFNLSRTAAETIDIAQGLDEVGSFDSDVNGVVGGDFIAAAFALVCLHCDRRERYKQLSHL
jgi:hypothetical protein